MAGAVDSLCGSLGRGNACSLALTMSADLTFFEYHPARLHTDPPGFAAWQGMARR